MINREPSFIRTSSDTLTLVFLLYDMQDLLVLNVFMVLPPPEINWPHALQTAKFVSSPLLMYNLSQIKSQVKS